MKKIAMSYLSTTFFPDIISLIPLMLYYVYFEYPQVWEKLYYLKWVRLVFSRSINTTVNRLVGKFEDFYQLSISLRNWSLMLSLIAKLAL